jgi:hypothetical protein
MHWRMRRQTAVGYTVGWNFFPRRVIFTFGTEKIVRLDEYMGR